MNQNDQQVFDDRFAQGNPVILLAEDDVIVRNLLLLALGRTEYAVLVAADGQEAIELSRAFHGKIDLVITDMEMPRMNGNELAEHLLHERPGVRILQISGQFAEHFTTRNLSLAFLHKPFRLPALLSKIQEVMNAPAGPRRSRIDASDLSTSAVGGQS